MAIFSLSWNEKSPGDLPEASLPIRLDIAPEESHPSGNFSCAVPRGSVHVAVDESSATAAAASIASMPGCCSRLVPGVGLIDVSPPVRSMIGARTMIGARIIDFK